MLYVSFALSYATENLDGYVEISSVFGLLLIVNLKTSGETIETTHPISDSFMVVGPVISLNANLSPAL